MISVLQGKIVNNSANEIVLMTAGGVGYRVMVSPSAAVNCLVGAEITLDTYLVVREDAMLLFGFASRAEKELFKQFLTVSGVGPKTGLHLLSLGSVEETTLAVGRGDTDYLTKVSGIGKKTAERIIVELKAKLAKGLGELDLAVTKNDAMSDVIDALVTLGYSVIEARDIVKKLDTKGKNSEQLLREALRLMSKS